VAQDENVTSFDNYAQPGDEACDVPALQIFPHKDSPTLATHPVYTLLIGTNDVGRVDPESYEPVFVLCHRAAVSWLGLPLEYKVLADSKDATTDGPGYLDSSNNWNAWVTEERGASVSFKITLDREGPIYAWPRIDDNSPGTYDYSLDGKLMGSGAMQTNPKIATKVKTTSSMGFLRLDGVRAGTHVVKFTQTNEGKEGVAVVGIGSPAGLDVSQRPRVYAGTIPFQEVAEGGRCSNSDRLCLAYILEIKDDVAEFAHDGLDVEVFDTRKYMFGTAAEMDDYLHPNVLGQKELSHSLEAVW
jgi:hypothetical protein